MRAKRGQASFPTASVGSGRILLAESAGYLLQPSLREIGLGHITRFWMKSGRCSQATRPQRAYLVPLWRLADFANSIRASVCMALRHCCVAEGVRLSPAAQGLLSVEHLDEVRRAAQPGEGLEEGFEHAAPAQPPEACWSRWVGAVPAVGLGTAVARGGMTTAAGGSGWRSETAR